MFTAWLNICVRKHKPIKLNNAADRNVSNRKSQITCFIDLFIKTLQITY